VIVLDDVGVGGAELGPVLRAIGEPDRFLPEGQSGLPPLWTLLAGSAEGLATAVAGVEGRFPVRPFVELSPYPEPALSAIVRDRFERACGCSAPPDLVQRVVRRALEDGLGARRAIDLLGREILGRDDRPVRSARRPDGLAIEPHVLRAIGAASQGLSAPLSDVRRFEAEIAASQGLRPLPTTTLWRRLVRLERAGYVRREIRTGGSGGTRSVLRLLTPIDEWATVPSPSGTPRAFGGPGVGGWPDPSGATELRPRSMGGFLEE